MNLICDFHIHTRYSDGKLSLSEIIDLYGKHNFAAIAITDHLCENNTLLGRSAKQLNKTLTQDNFSNYLNDIEFEKKRAMKLYNMLVIPGVEITKNSFSHKNSAHILGLGINGYINPNNSIENICDQIRRQGGLTIAAHPVATGKFEHQTYYLWNHRKRLESHFDAWEVASGSKLFSKVLKSHLPKIANSDLHHPKQIYSWKTIVNCSRNQEAIFQAIKNQNLSFKYYHKNLIQKASVKEVINAFLPAAVTHPQAHF